MLLHTPIIFYLLKDLVTPHSTSRVTKKTHDKNTKKPLIISLGIFPFNGNLAF
jgi:hypothetical protein